MNTQIVCTYTVQPVGRLTQAQLQTALAAVPLDFYTLNKLGLAVLSDEIIDVSTAVERQITLLMGPINEGDPGSVTATLANPGAPTSIKGYTVTASGGLSGGSHVGYVRVPLLSIADPTGSGASATATLGVFGYRDLVSGSGYSGATTITATGGELAPGGVQATFTPVIVGNAITDITIVTNGGPYNKRPKLVIADSGGGTGASATALLGLTGVVPGYAGEGYTNPTVTVVPYFKDGNPDASNQAATVAAWMQDVFQNALGCPVQVASPVVS